MKMRASPFQALLIIMLAGTLLTGCSWFSKEDEKTSESLAVIPPFLSNPNDWIAEQAAFTVMPDPSESDVTEFARDEQFAVGQRDPVTRIQVKLVWLEGDLTKEQRDLFDRTGQKIKGSVLHEMTFHFRFDQSSLIPEELKSMKSILGKIRYTPHRILVAGRTDSIGTESYNLRLSEKRAWTVREELVTHGANPKAIILRAYGETRPLADNDTTEGRAKNRSVTVRWLSDNDQEKTP